MLISLAWIAIAHAKDCPRKGTLGTSRILTVDAVSFPQVGSKNFPQTLPLRDHEVVLTFDDGPWPPTTPKVLAALARECVRATFFLIGKPASEHPTMVRRIAAEGHTIGHHTWTHFDLQRMPQSNAFKEIDDGIAAVEKADARGCDHDPDDTVFPLSRLSNHAGNARPVAIARNCGVWSRFLG